MEKPLERGRGEREGLIRVGKSSRGCVEDYGHACVMDFGVCRGRGRGRRT